MSKQTRTLIKEDLLDQLARSGIEEKYHVDLIEDYMQFWDAKKKLQADIRKRGVAITYNNGGGQSGVKKNDSVGECIRVNTQMMLILDKLGLKPVTDVSGEDEELKL